MGTIKVHSLVHMGSFFLSLLLVWSAEMTDTDSSAKTVEKPPIERSLSRKALIVVADVIYTIYNGVPGFETEKAVLVAALAIAFMAWWAPITVFRGSTAVAWLVGLLVLLRGGVRLVLYCFAVFIAIAFFAGAFFYPRPFVSHDLEVEWHANDTVTVSGTLNNYYNVSAEVEVQIGGSVLMYCEPFFSTKDSGYGKTLPKFTYHAVLEPKEIRHVHETVGRAEYIGCEKAHPYYGPVLSIGIDYYMRDTRNLLGMWFQSSRYHTTTHVDRNL